MSSSMSSAQSLLEMSSVLVTLWSGTKVMFSAAAAEPFEDTVHSPDKGAAGQHALVAWDLQLRMSLCVFFSRCLSVSLHLAGVYSFIFLFS